MFPIMQKLSFSLVSIVITLVLASTQSAVLSAQDCQSQLNRMTELVNKSAKDIDAYKKENAEQDRSIKRMKTTITDRDKQIDSLTADLAARKVDIATLTNTGNTLTATLALRRTEIQQRDSLIAAQKADIATLNKNLREQTDTANTLLVDLNAAQKDLAIKNEYIIALKNDIEAKRKENATQSDLLANISKEAVQTLRREVDALKKDLAALKSSPTQPKAGEPKK
jgi:chromosome segregation ATPase